MAGSYIKENNNIKAIDRAAVKDINGDYRIAKKVYAKVDVNGTLYWEPVLTSKGIYNVVLKEDVVEIVSVEDFEVEKTININDFQIGKVVYANDAVYLHEYANFNRTAKINMNDLTINLNFGENWFDVDADINGNVYFLSSNGISVIDNQGVATNHNITLQSGETFTRFCADKDGFCYALTTNDRLFKSLPSTQTISYSISLSIAIDNDETISVDDTNLYIGTDFNVFTSINKVTGAQSTKITSLQRPKQLKTDNLGNVYAIFQETNIGKFDASNGNLLASYSMGSGYNITDIDVSFNGNVYAVATNGTSFKVVKTNSDLQQTYISNPLIQDNNIFKIGVFPGNVGAGFWDKYVN